MSLRIETDNLQLRYGDTVAVDGLTLSLEGGKIYGLLGRNGSGKSSLLSVLAAFRQASAGEARIDGEPVFENAHVTRQICLIRETGDTLDDGERIEAAFKFASAMRPYWDGDYAARLLERFRLSPRKKLGELSRGQRATVACTLGLASRAPVTMFDESYLGMDAPSRYVFYDELLADFMAHPRTVIISTHLIEEVSSLFEEVVIIDNGRLVLHEDAETLRARGVEVTGPAEAVDGFVDGLEVLGERRLGGTKAVTVYGDLDGGRREAARNRGLELGPVALQDLFVHLTTSERDDR